VKRITILVENTDQVDGILNLIQHEEACGEIDFAFNVKVEDEEDDSVRDEHWHYDDGKIKEVSS